MNKNREEFLWLLRNNPKNREQYYRGSLFLYDEDGNIDMCCAIGLWYDYKEFEHDEYYSSFKIFLDLEDGDLGDIWSLNDLQGRSFSEIADILEERWT